MDHYSRATTKASRRRLLADMATAARIVEEACRLYPFKRMEAHRRAYVFGALHAASSKTVAACILTAFGA